MPTALELSREEWQPYLDTARLRSALDLTPVQEQQRQQLLDRVGLTFGESLGGVVWGTNVSEVMVDLTGLGVDDKFMTIIEQTMDNDSSAIFVFALNMVLSSSGGESNRNRNGSPKLSFRGGTTTRSGFFIRNLLGPTEVRVVRCRFLVEDALRVLRTE